MRFGENPAEVIKRVKERIKVVEGGLARWGQAYALL